MSDVMAVRHPVPEAVRTLDVLAKAALLLLMFLAVTSPDLGNMQDKGAHARAIGYPLAAFLVPFIWYVWWRDRASFPWLADLLVTVTCFTDTLGNRMDLYDSISWFDDWMHFMNTGLLTAAAILLTLHRGATLGRILERSLAFGATAGIVWELAEYATFLSKSTERRFAYTDTLGDLTLNTLGAVVAGLVIFVLWSRGQLHSSAPQLEHRVSTRI
ncbi:hypothetical protein [Nocardioides sp. zg-DK7169]|uniref:hypothetical protein n=1 Tax=Nocardioides sp. zg-DK7169 TaxID=2736600 RepID=UPI001557C6EA|nr:hypothetical protein [Nocardioides sp. zg-DK7169]NPC97778.1 hypothetical protein [Nocardioides sp. zg-DK7169]